MFLVAAAATAVVAADVEISTCGAVVPAGGKGFLIADLDCSAASGNGVSLGNGAILDLKGFGIIGNPTATNADGVTCEGNCSVVGPGTIRDFPWHAVSSPTAITLEGVTISNQGLSGIFANRAKISSSTFVGNGGSGVLRGHASTDR